MLRRSSPPGLAGCAAAAGSAGAAKPRVSPPPAPSKTARPPAVRLGRSGAARPVDHHPHRLTLAHAYALNPRIRARGRARPSSSPRGGGALQASPPCPAPPVLLGTRHHRPQHSLDEAASVQHRRECRRQPARPVASQPMGQPTGPRRSERHARALDAVSRSSVMPATTPSRRSAVAPPPRSAVRTCHLRKTPGAQVASVDSRPGEVR